MKPAVFTSTEDLLSIKFSNCELRNNIENYPKYTALNGGGYSEMCLE